MEKRERDTWDDLFRSKLQDLEMDTAPDDWEAIASRLPDKKTVPFRKSLRYWAAAAVLSLLMITGSMYVFERNEGKDTVADKVEHMAKQIETQQTKRLESIAERVEPVGQARPIVAANVDPVVRKSRLADFRTRVVDTKSYMENLPEEISTVEDTDPVVERDEQAIDSDVNPPSEDPKRNLSTRAVSSGAVTTSLLAETTPQVQKKETSSRKWGFGMGGGSVSAGSDNSVNTYAFKNTTLQDMELMSLNSPHFNKELPKTNIHHKTPVTIGVSVSRFLNKRFSLQSGLTYSFLSSSWETNGAYHNETKQKLHFLGLPLSLSYQIAEWKQIQLYAAAGGMMEVNVAGRLDTKQYSGGKEFRHQSEKTRMDALLWSVNARVGASYPLFRFMSLYAEVGAGYYFDNDSPIETIRSEKPFNVNLQAGFRFGF